MAVSVGVIVLGALVLMAGLVLASPLVPAAVSGIPINGGSGYSITADFTVGTPSGYSVTITDTSNITGGLGPGQVTIYLNLTWDNGSDSGIIAYHGQATNTYPSVSGQHYYEITELATIVYEGHAYGRTTHSADVTIGQATAVHYTVSFGVTSGSGTVTVNGASTSSTSSISLVKGDEYVATAAPATNYYFVSWSGTYVTIIGSSTTASIDIEPTGNGTLFANFAKTTYTLTLTTLGPPMTACSNPLTFNGTSYRNSSLSFPTTGLGAKSISAGTCTGYTFLSWGTSGSVSVASATSLSTTATVSGNGTLTLSYSQNLVTYTVDFVTSPTTCGSIAFGATSKTVATYTNGQSKTNVSAGHYYVSAAACSGMSLESLVGSGSVSAWSGNSTAYVGGSGMITATFWTGPPASSYSVTFTESGLTSGTSWSVILASTTGSSSTSTVQFSEANGTYSYTVTAPTGYSIASGGSGSLTVAGSGVGESVSFTPAHYTIGFLANPSICLIQFNGTGYTSGSTASVVGGSYPVGYETCNGYTPASLVAANGVSISGGTAIVTGAGSITATWTANAPTPATLTCDFTVSYTGFNATAIDHTTQSGVTGLTVSLSWGDGSPAVNIGVDGTEDHAYAKGGNYTVTETASGSGTTASGTTGTVTGTHSIIVPISGIASSISVKFSYKATGLTVNVTDETTTVDITGLVLTISWGDGVTSPIAQIVSESAYPFAGTAAHTYASQGNYVISETASGAGTTAAGTSTTVTAAVTQPVSVAAGTNSSGTSQTGNSGGNGSPSGCATTNSSYTCSKPSSSPLFSFNGLTGLLVGLGPGIIAVAVPGVRNKPIVAVAIVVGLAFAGLFGGYYVGGPGLL